MEKGAKEGMMRMERGRMGENEQKNDGRGGGSGGGGEKVKRARGEDYL